MANYGVAPAQFPEQAVQLPPLPLVMPPILASALTVGAIIFLLWRELHQAPKVSAALWLPFFWILIACSRAVSEWLHLFGVPVPGGTLEDGSLIDRLYYVTLILAGIVVLRRRQVSLQQLIADNRWLALFLVYCFLAILWSDYPFVSLKRWIKVLGHPVMALIILTDPDPREAFTRVFKRCSYFLILVSVLFIKYYPEWGRGFSYWTGAAYNTGITADKNMLGINCLLLGYVYLWHLLYTFKQPRSPEKRNELLLALLLLLLNFWLLSIADSKTPFVSLVLGSMVLLFTGLSWVRPHLLGIYFLAALFLGVGLQWLFDIYGAILQLLGRTANLTDRTLLWADLLKVEINPFIGTGFESFWLGERLQALWKVWDFRPNQAHNGYLETYLNLGLIGLSLLFGLLISAFRNAVSSFQTDPWWGRLTVGLLVAMLAYNWTEAAFKTTHPIFFVFYIIAIAYRSGWRNPIPNLKTEPVAAHQHD
jgi:exopolysaccharide production protein ExoQ